MPNFTLVGAGAWVRDPGNCGEFYKFWKYNLSLRRTCPLRHSYEIFKFYVRFLAAFLCYFARGSGGENIVMSTSVCVSVCLSVCLSASISLQSHARSLPIFLRMLPMVMARSSSGRVTKSQGEGAVLGVFFPTDNALCGIAIAFETHTKTAEPIDMPFDMMTRVGMC